MALGTCWSWQGGGRAAGRVLGTLAATGGLHLHFMLLTEYIYLLILLGRGRTSVWWCSQKVLQTSSARVCLPRGTNA